MAAGHNTRAEGVCAGNPLVREENELMPLSFYPSGQQVPIRKIGGKDDVKRFLNSLGFIEGETVTVVSRLGGNMIVNVKDTRVALDSNLAQRILV